MAATSWNRSIENPACPLRVGSRLRSFITDMAMAVLDMAKPRAATTAKRQPARLGNQWPRL